jgi:hypothetical protein
MHAFGGRAIHLLELQYLLFLQSLVVRHWIQFPDEQKWLSLQSDFDWHSNILNFKSTNTFSLLADFANRALFVGRTLQ